MNQETGEVHGSSFAELTYANVDFNTPSPASKDKSRTTLPSRSLGDRYKPPVFGEPTALRSVVFKPTAYQPNVFTTPELAPDARREVVTKARDPIFLNKSTRLEDLPALRARLATIRDLRELNYSDAEIETMVSNMDNVGLSFPDLLEKLRNGPPSDIATKKAERAQSNVGVRPTTSTTPTTPVKRNVPTYSLNPSDVEGRRTQLPVRSRATTKTVKSRFSVENLASVQTDPTTRAELDRVLAMDKSKVPKEKVPEEEFETLNLDSDEEEWDKIDVEDEWEVVDDPRVEMEKNQG
ncbi:hypothetical protein J4E93_005480 [Alternaria ventricosa]|uniref:uncharacterized protein n=1 Tax=Alternaria ventricosa TaxID=1187951 RepID=UPI0020C3C185|nr:uncharacterized protein J4E93_005480 [Alternaria ventricosa]KAI4645902.1 hypothetical protein J4E93_005480 [Alternaria ventricosa]